MNRSIFIGAIALLSVVLFPLRTFSQAAPAQFNSIKEILESLPRQATIGLRGGGERAEPAAAQTNALLKQTAHGKTAALRVRIARVDKAPGTAYAWKIQAETETIRVGSTTAPTNLVIYAAESETASVAKLKKGSEITAVGRLGRTDFTVTPKLVFHIDLGDTKFQ